MSAKWEQGDVALVPGVGLALMLDDGRWVTQVRGKFHDADSFDRFLKVRPLVVIDPEDREAVERLAKAVHESDHIAPWHDQTRGQVEEAMQAALREFANPAPPPEEPTGLGAVVEDAEGVRWVRVGKHGQDDLSRPWARHGNIGYIEGWVAYDAIATVRVLSEGVTA